MKVVPPGHTGGKVDDSGYLWGAVIAIPVTRREQSENLPSGGQGAG